MLNKLTVLLAALTVVGSGTAIADVNKNLFIENATSKMFEKQEQTDEYTNSVGYYQQYKILPQTSTIKFSVDSPIGEISGSFQDFEGSFSILDTTLHEQRKTTSININTESLNTDSGFIAILLKSESFFDVDVFPSMHFSGRKFEWYNDTQAVLTGHMTIKNVTRKVSFYVEVVDEDVGNTLPERIRMIAKANIKRSDFDIHTLLPVVSDNVNLHVSIDALPNNTGMSMSMLQ